MRRQDGEDAFKLKSQTVDNVLNSQSVNPLIGKEGRAAEDGTDETRTDNARKIQFVPFTPTPYNVAFITLSNCRLIKILCIDGDSSRDAIYDTRETGKC